MNYHNITKDDMLNGDGLRVVLWVAGCTHHCANCQNPITWDVAGGLPFDEAAEKEVFRLIKKVRKELPQKTIWLYTGFLWNEIKDIPEIADIDVICEGKFVNELLDNKLHWVGSSNQKVIDVKKTLATNSEVYHET